MKKYAVVAAALLLVCVMPSFADVGIGVAVFSDTPILGAADVNRELLEGSFSFGANGRIKFGSLSLDALGLYQTAAKSIDLYLTAQLSKDFLGFLRLSGGVGPAIHFPLNGGAYAPEQEITVDWLNAKIDFDVLLFGFSAGLSFQYLVPSSEYATIDFNRARGRIGMSVLVW